MDSKVSMVSRLLFKMRSLSNVVVGSKKMSLKVELLAWSSFEY